MSTSICVMASPPMARMRSVVSLDGTKALAKDGVRVAQFTLKSFMAFSKLLRLSVSRGDADAAAVNQGVQDLSN